MRNLCKFIFIFDIASTVLYFTDDFKTSCFNISPITQAIQQSVLYSQDPGKEIEF